MHTDKVQLRQGDRPLRTRVLQIMRTGPDVDQGWIPGPHGYWVRLAASDTGDDTGAPLVLELVDGNGTLVATAEGIAPRREELNHVLTQSVISRPLLDQMRHAGPSEEFDVVIDVNLAAGTARTDTLRRVSGLVSDLRDGHEPQVIEQYVFARMSRSQIEQMVAVDLGTDESVRGDVGRERRERSIHRVWPDFPVRALLDHSVPTIKADAARAAFSAAGRGIMWGVIDSGIAQHPHFASHHNLEIDDPTITHQDFITEKTGDEALVDEFGHGTHVAGIIAGEQAAGTTASAAVHERTSQDSLEVKHRDVVGLRGVAPECKLLSLRVLDETGGGPMRRIIAALSYVNKVNDYGRNIRVQGVNMSLGYDFDPEWFACGQSPLCKEVDRLVATGVVVVVAAGNSGWVQVGFQSRAMSMSMDLTINDPGNAERAITVGATHGQAPHTYGVSFFSSRGPTGDGRLKPDLVAPGERIVSCATGKSGRLAGDPNANPTEYVEMTGTSQAAPHVSGAAAAFLSIRPEFIGQPDRIKQLFMDTATDLGRSRTFQGAGLIDLMRAIQAI
jgi:subtilisin family serine protease